MILPNDIETQNILVNNVYSYVQFKRYTIPYQGWKIHISGTLENYQDILNKVHSICNDNKIDYKYINNTDSVLHIFSKKANPIEVGKFITLYPPSKKEFLSLLEQLYEALKSYQGIQVLTDRYYKDSQVIHYRFGVMNAKLYEQGRPKLVDKEGTVFEDIVGPYYQCPVFEDDSFEFKEEDTDSLLHNRYEMKLIIHESGSGNVYLAIDTESNQKVVIKEARRNTYVSEHIKARDLLQNEKEKLLFLEGCNVPTFIEDFDIDENYYLVEKYIEGKTLDELKNEYNILHDFHSESKRLFNKKIKNVVFQTFSILEDIHLRGVIVEDISLSNIILTNEGEVYFIDLETSYYKGGFPMITTQNMLLPNRMKQSTKVADRIKLWYCIIGLLTNASIMLNFDSSGKKTIQLFIKMCTEHGGLTEIIDLLSRDLEIKHTKKKVFPSKYINLGLDIAKLLKTRGKIIETLMSQSAIELDGEDFVEYYENKKAIKNCGLNITRKEKKFRDNLFERRLVSLYLYNNNRKVEQFLNTIEVNQLQYRQKYYLLKFLNDKMMDRVLFKQIVNSIIKNDIDYDNKKIPYIRSGKYLNPYLINGSAGLLIELIRFSEKEKCKEYRTFIKKLSRGMQHPYAKGTSLYSGMVGIALANLWLYHYFNKLRYLRYSLYIFNHVIDYSIQKNNLFVLIDPMQDKVNYGFSKGMLGCLYYIDMVLETIKYKEVKDYEKISIRL